MDTKELIGQLDKEAPAKILSLHVVDAGEIVLSEITHIDKVTSQYTDDDGTKKDVDRFYLIVAGKDKPVMCPKSVMQQLNAIVKAMEQQNKKVIAFSAFRMGSGKGSKYTVSPRLG